jgi:hypothetical protein
MPSDTRHYTDVVESRETASNSFKGNIEDIDCTRYHPKVGSSPISSSANDTGSAAIGTHPDRRAPQKIDVFRPYLSLTGPEVRTLTSCPPRRESRAMWPVTHQPIHICRPEGAY